MWEIKDLKQLSLFLSEKRRLYLYGAGFHTGNFLRNLRACGIRVKFESVLVTEQRGNPDRVYGLPVIQYDKVILDEKDCILLTVSNRFKDEIVEQLRICKAQVVYPSQCIFYNDVYESIRPLIEIFPKQVSGLNRPVAQPRKLLWTCWWQGKEEAPDIVRACWETQKQNLPVGTEHIILTKYNYEDYITIPEYVLERFDDGKSDFAHLADFIRACLLYKWGGVWLDSTVFVVNRIPDECWQLPLYTWMFEDTHFAAETIWTTWFLAARKGSLLWEFVMESFLYYFKKYDRVKYYLTIDYFIAICTNLFDEVLKQFQEIPYNNKNADNLVRHLREVYSEQTFKRYCEGTFLQKLTWHEKRYSENSIYTHIIREYLA